MHKGLKSIGRIEISFNINVKQLQEHKMALFPTFFLAKLVMSTNVETMPRSCKTLFMLSSNEYEIYYAHKC